MKRPSIEALERGIERGERAALGRAITLVESRIEQDQWAAQTLIERILPRTGRAVRVGVTGVPGAGKSTLLDALGMLLVDDGARVAVLAVDPSSATTGGSILGDKTRMARLSRSPRAFIRPSPSGGVLGGVAPRTRDAMLLVEAAGYDVVLVETVGVGQSETAVHGMVDSLVWITIPHAGDELQGIKRGVLELAEVVVVNKADGEREAAALRAQRELESALRHLPRTHPSWRTPVLTASALGGVGLENLWEAVLGHRRTLEADGSLERRRREQRKRALWAELQASWLRDLLAQPRLRALLATLEEGVAEGRVAPGRAALEARSRVRVVCE